MAEEVPHIFGQPSLSVLVDLCDQEPLTSFFSKSRNYLF